MRHVFCRYTTSELRQMLDNSVESIRRYREAKQPRNLASAIANNRELHDELVARASEGDPLALAG